MAVAAAAATAQPCQQRERMPLLPVVVMQVVVRLARAHDGAGEVLHAAAEAHLHPGAHPGVVVVPHCQLHRRLLLQVVLQVVSLPKVHGLRVAPLHAPAEVSVRLRDVLVVLQLCRRQVLLLLGQQGGAGRLPPRHLPHPVARRPLRLPHRAQLFVECRLQQRRLALVARPLLRNAGPQAALELGHLQYAHVVVVLRVYGHHYFLRGLLLRRHLPCEVAHVYRGLHRVLLPRLRPLRNQALPQRHARALDVLEFDVVLRLLVRLRLLLQGMVACRAQLTQRAGQVAPFRFRDVTPGGVPRDDVGDAAAALD
jgi:hypothetical protein